MGASFNKSENKAYGNQDSRTLFPIDFLSNFSNAYGQGVNLNELLAGLPRSSSLFGGSPVGIFPTASGGGGGYPTGAQGLGFGPPPGSAQPGGSPGGPPSGGGQLPPQILQMLGFNPSSPAGMGGGGQPGAPQGAPGGAPQGQQGQRGTIGLNDLNALTAQFGNQQQVAGMLHQIWSRAGLQPDSRITMEQLQQLGAQSAPGFPLHQQELATYLQNLQGLQSPANRFQASGSPVGVDVLGGVQRLGFGQMPNQAQVPTIGNDLERIYGPQAMAAQTSPIDYQGLQNSMFESQYRPVERELNRQGDLADRRLQDQLAAAGISSSGAGIGQRQTARREVAQQVQNAATDAANRASQQRFGLQYQEAQDNANRRQQTALANAGFDLQAQQANASQLLQGDIARSDAYLRTIGLNNDMANQARSQFLNLLGVQQQDLQRMDQFQIQTLGMILNNWLQEGALAQSAGQISSGTSTSRGASIGQSAGISG